MGVLRSRAEDGALAAWVAAGREQGRAGVVAAAARRLAIARGLDPDGVDELLGGTTCGAPDALPVLRAPDELGRLHEALAADPRARKTNGAFFTPAALADALVEAALARSAIERPTVVDPACGAGAFLLPIVRRLGARLPGGVATAVQHCVAGVDRDPETAAVCRVALWLAAADPRLEPAVVARRIVVGDAVVGTAWGAAGGVRERDRWCARWFVGSGEQDDAGALDRAAARIRPVHWDLAFPDTERFDMVVGNPPWEVDKADARAFFSRFDPRHRERDKQDAVRVQRQLMAADPTLAAAWRAERELAAARGGFCRARFRLQPAGGDPNAYQRFVELGLELLRPGGRLAMLVPAGMYADLGSRRLRDALLDEHGWERLCGFENRARLFRGVDGRFKLAAIIVRKGGGTRATEVSFMQREPAGLLGPGTAFPRDTVAVLSPRSGAFVEIDEPESLELLDRLRRTGTTFADARWSITFRRELDLTLDSARFEAVGGSSRPRDGDDLLVPVWEGRMVGAFDGVAKAWVAGHGRKARWREVRTRDAAVEPQYQVPVAELARVDPDAHRPKVGFMAIGSATNARTMIATVLWRAACGNSVPTLRCRAAPSGAPGELALCAVLNSFTYDWALRARMAGNNLNRFLLDETPLPDPDVLLSIDGLAAAVASLCWTQPWFGGAWQTLPASERARAQPLLADDDRRHIRAALDAIIAACFGLRDSDLRHVLRDCDLPGADVARRAREGRIAQKGFWRVDRGLPPERRLPALTLGAFAELQRGLAKGTTLSAASTALLERRLAPARVGSAPCVARCSSA